jgi:hypothetical protein
MLSHVPRHWDYILSQERPHAREAASMANHSSTRTTQLYDRRSDEVNLNEFERILI